MNPSSEAFPIPKEEEAKKYMQAMQHLLDLPSIQRIHSTMSANPDDLMMNAVKFQLVDAGLRAIILEEYLKLREKCGTTDSTIQKLVLEKADLEKRVSGVTEKLNDMNREMEEVRGQNSRLNRENEELRGLNSKLNGENEEVGGLNSKLNFEMEELHGQNSKLNREMEEVRGLNSELRGRNSEVSKRLVELGGEIELAREESMFHRSKNERLCSEVNQARVENERLQGLVDDFRAREHAIKLEGVNEYASNLRFYRRFTHFARPILTFVGQMGVAQMAKIAKVKPISFELEQDVKLPRAGPYEPPKLGELDFDDEFTLEAWNVKELYDPDKVIVSHGGKRKANDLLVRAPSRPRNQKSKSIKTVLAGKHKYQAQSSHG